MAKDIIACPDCGKIVSIRFPMHECKPNKKRKEKGNGNQNR